MRPSPVTLSTIALLVAATWAGPRAHAAKPGPILDPEDWACSIQLRDAPGDTITSDGGGAYVHGTGGVTCRIDRTRHYNWLYVQIAASSARFMLFPGQAAASGSYVTFQNRAPGTFEVKGLADVAWTGVAYADVMPFRALAASSQFAKGIGLVDGDSNFTGASASSGTSSVFVEPLDACSWRITSYTVEDTSALMVTSGERAGTVSFTDAYHARQ